MQDMKEIKVLLSAEDSDVETFWTDIEDVFRDQYFLEAAETGLQHYEKMLGIVPKATDDMETRKFRIFAKFNERLPYTEITVNKQLEILCGVGNYTMEVIFERYAVIVRIALVSKRKFEEVKEMLRNILPANLLLDIDLLYNQHMTFEDMTHGKMSEYKHIELREEEVS